MAKIYIKSRDPIIIDIKKALKIKEDWLANPKSQDIVDVDGEFFKMCDIKSISGATDKGEDYFGKKYDLDIPEDRAKVKAFEREFLLWLTGDGKQYDIIMAQLRFYEAKGACKIRGDGLNPSNMAIVDSVLYTKLSNLWSSWQDLRMRRQKAKETESQAMDSLAESKDELKGQLETFKSELPPKEREDFETMFGE